MAKQLFRLVTHFNTAYFHRILIAIVFLSFCTCRASATVPPSSIHLSVETTSADLAAIINQSLPNEMYKAKLGLGASVTVLRTGPIGVTASDNFVYLTLPIQLAVSNALYESQPLRTSLRFKAKVNVTPDWRLKTELYYTGLSDNLAESIRLGPLTLQPKSMVDAISQSVQKLLAPIIDAKINKSLQLRTKITPVWQNAFNPTLVSKEFGVWLKLTPEKIVMSPLLAAHNRVQLSIGIVTGTEVVIGPKPLAASVRPLPPLQQLADFDKSFHFQLSVELFFSDLVTALNPVLLDKSFGDDKKITIKKFNLKGEDGSLVVVLSSTGAFDGELTLFAKPVFNSRSNSLAFEDVDFDTKNTEWLIGAGSWLLSSPIRMVIKSKLNSTVAEQLEKARLKASSALSSVQLAEHAKLSGTVTSLTLGETTVFTDRMTNQVIAQGELGVSLK